MDANYYHVVVGGQKDTYSLEGGWELLEGSGAPGDAFQTPLATLHIFNGWSDQFVVTPDTGLQDIYIAVGAGYEKAKFRAIYHDFEADTGGSSYGSEINLEVTYPLEDNVTVGLSYADYDADGFSVDTQKAWIWITLSI